ncbi:MAG: hypothetical protein GY822_08105 [Deltaproteobacteria bacterium]|nr:hypothetical protein [Deltaproteobacteria bacterium]
MLGHAGVVVYTDEVDLVHIGRGLMRFCAVESCGKCFPCRLGSVRGADVFDKIIDDQGDQDDLELLAELCETMQFGSLCALGGGIPTPIHNLLTTFIGAFSRYIPDAKIQNFYRITQTSLQKTRLRMTDASSITSLKTKSETAPSKMLPLHPSMKGASPRKEFCVFVDGKEIRLSEDSMILDATKGCDPHPGQKRLKQSSRTDFIGVFRRT